MWDDEPTKEDIQPLTCWVETTVVVPAGRWDGLTADQIRNALRGADPRQTQEIPAVTL